MAPELQWAEDEVVQSLCEDSFYDFVREAWNQVEDAPFVDNWHIGAIADHLQAVTIGQIKKLLINIPPGCSKSLLTCVFWPVWEWLRCPSVRWFFSSYDQRLSTRDSVKCRNLILSHWFQSRWGDRFHLTQDQNQKTYYETSEKGYRLATSVGGHGTGEHPDRIVVDDPHNVKEAESETERQSTLDWWDQTMSTRGVAREARRVIIMQRLHHNDLSGHVMKKGDYVHICLPMRYERDRMKETPLGWKDPRRQEGELLTPRQFDEVKVKEMEDPLGAYGIAGQMQQRPQPKGGGMFKSSYFTHFVKAAPHEGKRVRFWDRASTEGGGCYSAGTLMCRSVEGDFYVEHVEHGQWEPVERNNRILAAAQRDRLRYGPKHDPVIWVEDEGGSTAKDANRLLAKKLAGFRVRFQRPTGSKDVRAEPWSCQLEAGNVFIVNDGTWDVLNWIKEHELFRPEPGKRLGKYKDQVDSAAAAFSLLLSGSQAGTLRTYSVGGSDMKKKSQQRIVICTPEELPAIQLDLPSLFLCLRDYGQEAIPSVHGLVKNLENLTLCFADVEPEQHQESFDDPLDAYGKPVSEVMMREEHGRKLWAFLRRQRTTNWNILVIEDDRGVGESIALAICNVSGYDPSIITIASNHEQKAEVLNSHVYNMVKATRSMVL